MITDAIVEAMDMMIDMCSSEEQAKGMKSIREMLCDFDEITWIDTENKTEWLEQFLSCARKEG